MIGQKIGVYHVHSLLGVGGMGEVYRARDTKLGRDVAIKVLPASLTAEADRLARFEREARVLASLNHQHIAAIYGVEDDSAVTGSIRALVLELVEGETLAERIEQGPLPVAEALVLARQIAAALDAAHEKGIVHRDLKPANIKITPDGVVKVLDFGIAKAVDEGVVSPVGGAAITAFASRALTVLGTAAYMSPEQARGHRVDKRTDIWAFGCVLYEMLTGRNAFAAETVTDTLARVVEREPDWSALPRDVPPGVRELLRRCLEKDIRKRLRDIGDASFEQGASAPPSAPSARRSLGSNMAWLAGGALLVAAGFAIWGSLPSTSTEQRANVTVRRFTDFVGMEEEPALSPDGKTVAFVARANGHRHVWLRLLAGGSPLQVTRDAVDHREPRWSTDSSRIIYFTGSSESARGGTLWEVPAFGGEPRPLTAAASGGDFSPDGNEIALVRFSDEGVELAIVSRDGSRTLSAQTLGPDGVFNSVRWSPDGRWLAVQRLDEAFNQVVLVVPSTGGEPVVVARSPRILGHTWLPDSSGIVYSSATGSTILYPPTSNLRMVGRDGAGDRALTFGDVSYTQPDIRGTGELVATRTQIQSDLWRFPLDGSPQENTRAAIRITRQTGQVQTAAVSADGTQVAYLSDSGGHGNIWVTNIDGSSTRQVTFEQDPDVSIGVPVWSSTGEDLAYIVSRGGTTGLWLVKSDGSSAREFVSEGIGANWSGDDRWLYYHTSTGGDSCILKRPMPAAAPPATVRCGGATSAAIAPDGSALYLVRFPSGVLEGRIERASPENAPSSTVLAAVALDRVPHHPRQLVPTVSPDGSALAMPLIDGQTTNLWVQPTNGDAMYPVTDFGDRAVLIARRVDWGLDGRSLYAAVADVDSDIVLLGGLLR